MNILDLPKDVRYSIGLFLCPRDIISLTCCNKKLANMLSDEQFWYRKLSQDFSCYSTPPLNLTLKIWYQLVHIMMTITDDYLLDELQMELFEKRKYEETAILFMAASYRGHQDIGDCLYKISPGICNISENTLPLTPNEFTCLGRVVDYLKIRHELYAKAQLTPLNPNLFFDFGEKDTFGWI